MTRVYPGLPPKKDRMWLSTAVKLVSTRVAMSDTLHLIGERGGRAGMRYTRTPERLLKRQRGMQGRPFKAALVREGLWDWFCDLRRSVVASLSPKFVLMKAKQLATQLVQEKFALGGIEVLPKIDRHWLLRWKRDKGVVFRKPNCRYKASLEVMRVRLRAMWLNTLRVRALAEALIGNDLSERMYGLDEKPIHFNEAGSKGIRTLELQGAPEVRLKQNHQATRERVSLMTCVTSNPEEAKSPANLPLEILFKAGSEKRTRNLKRPRNLKVSITWAVKGSYRLEHILAYLRRWLPEWTPARTAARDYRILMLDVAKSHCDPAVTNLAWSRGYITLYHYGCTTGVAQVNDTDLHGDFERVYLEAETAAFMHQQYTDPGNITRRPQHVVDDACAVWGALDHQKGCRGHKSVGLSNSLTGEEDCLISREARRFWEALNMPAERLRAIQSIRDRVASGELTSMEDWRAKGVVVHPADPGIMMLEGEELQDALGEGEAVYEDQEHKALCDADDEDVKQMDAIVATSRAQPIVVSIVDGDAVEDITEATGGARRLAALKRLRAETLKEKLNVPRAIFTFDKEISELERGIRSRSCGEKQINQVLRRSVEENRVKEQEAVDQARKRARRRAQKARQEKRAAKAKAKAKAVAAKATVERMRRLAALPMRFTKADLGVGQQSFKARCTLLERIRLNSPALPEAEALQWVDLRDRYARQFKVDHPLDTGGHFVRAIEAVQRALAEHYKMRTRFNGPGHAKGDPDAFLKFIRRIRRTLPADRGVIMA